jgi:hypothetical protein
VNKKEAKKTLIYLARAVETPVAHEQKFFASFFQKRSSSLLLIPQESYRLNPAGALPVQRLKARLKALCSE